MQGSNTARTDKVWWVITYRMDASIELDSRTVVLVARQSENAQRSPLIVSGITFILAFGTLALFWFVQVRKYYSPSSDEFALFVNSAKPFHPIFSEWFLQGFSRYFVPYPEWSIASTNFARPVANAEYYLSSLAFGTHWSCYLLSTYCIQSALVASVVHFSLRRLGLRIPAAVGIGFVCFVSPAFDNGALYSTSFAFDLLAALFVIAGLNQLLSRKLFLAWILFAAALFTKETALFAPLAAAVVLYRMSSQRGLRRLLVPACFLLPYAAWTTLRFIAFRGPKGIYAIPVDSPGTYLLRILKDFLRWPIPFETPYGTTWVVGSIPVSLCVFVTMNLCFWIAVIHFSLRFLRSRMSRGLTQASDPRVARDSLVSPMMEVLLLFCIGSIAILLLIPNLQPRFGATFVPLFALMLVVFLQATNSKFGRTFACMLLVVPPIINVTNRMLRFPDDLLSVHAQWAMAADYIHKISRAASPSIYVVDDVSGGFSSSEFIRRFAGYQGQLVRVNDLIWRENCTVQPEVDIQEVANDHIKVTSEFDSPCAGHGFLFSRMEYPIGGGELSRSISHTRIIYHGVPAATVRFLSNPGRLSVDITNAAASSVLLVPNLNSKTYREVPFDR
jgi:hypothetical protein